MNMSIKSMTIATLLATTAPVAALAQADVSVGANSGASASVEGAGADARASENVSGNASGNADGTAEGARDHASETAQGSSAGSGSVDVDVDGDAETDGQGDGAGATADLDITTFGRLVSQLQAGEIADPGDFADFTIGTDGEVEVVTLSDLREIVTLSDSQGNGAEARAQFDSAIDAGAKVDYSQLPEGVFEGTDYDVENVVAALISAEGNLVVVVDDTD